MKYNYCYKYYKIINYIIEISYDNTIGSGIYSAKTNSMFKDNEGDFGHACGVGKDENEALKNCLQELSIYLKSKDNKFFNISMLKKYNLPFRISFVLQNDENASCYFKVKNNKLEILTNNNKFYIDILDANIIYTLEQNISKIQNSNNYNFSIEYLKSNGFFPTFDNLTCIEKNL